MPTPRAIAIDGPVASGKTVVGRAVAVRLGYRFLDTGTMYRAVTWAAIRRGVELADCEALASLARSIAMRLEAGDRLTVDGEDVTGHLRDDAVQRAVSSVSAVPGVRTALVSQQQAVADRGPIVMVGRDIGTDVLPDARIKIFLRASAEVRARRRYDQMREGGGSISYDRVVCDLAHRDKIDSERAVSPLRPAPDAIVIETDHMTVEQVIERVQHIAESV